MTIRGEQERDLTREIPSSGQRLLLPLLGQAHGLLVGLLELAVELVHGTNQLIRLSRQLLEHLGIYKCLGWGIGRFLVGRSEMLCQLRALSHLFGTPDPAAIHEELRRTNVSEVPRKGAMVEGADVLYLVGRDDDIAQCVQRGGQGS
jgi:hypothetical protein